MTNLIELARMGADAVLTAAQEDWRISAGMIAAGFVIGIAEWLRQKRKARKK